MQTLRACCSKAEPKKFRPAADPLPGGAVLVSGSDDCALSVYCVLVLSSVRERERETDRQRDRDRDRDRELLWVLLAR